MDIPRLHPDTIEEVKSRLDIVELISEYVVLKKRGRDYLGLCPFHEEKSPSFSVSPTKQFYYCFGCQAGGNGFKFLMEIGQRSFGEVVLDLAKRYQVPVKTLEPEQRQALQRQLSLREQLFEVVALANAFFQHALFQPQGQSALEYLHQKRGLPEDTIREFGLGYAPAGWETLFRYLTEQKRYPVALLEQAGLIKARSTGNGYYDQFRDRVTIPIADRQGRVIGFGSRTLTGEEPKYLNSPETPLFSKGQNLYGLDRAKAAITKRDEAVVVEGYFDAIALHRAGFTQTVASLGTAFTQEQLRQLLRYTESKRVILNFDADRAGVAATQRAIVEIEDLIYNGQVQLRVLNLPGGKDADEFLNSAPTAASEYQQQLIDAPLWLEWQIEQLLCDRDLTQADQFQSATTEMVKLLGKIEQPSLRHTYIANCAERLARDSQDVFKLSTGDFKRLSESLHSEVNKVRKGELNERPLTPETVSSSEANRLDKAEALLLRIYLHCPLQRQGIAQTLEDKDLLFSRAQHRFLWRLVWQITEESGITCPDLVSRLQDSLLAHPQEQRDLQPLLQLTEKT
ncbi:MAG: DNA primase, partial [Cyanobacteria bacterium P01_H01_bin.15]